VDRVRRKKYSFNGSYAISELVGGMLLVLIAISAFALVYNFVFPLPIPESETNTELIGYVNEQGQAIIEHMGGEPLYNYEIYIDGDLAYTSDGTVPWQIGGKKIGGTDLQINEHLNVIIYSINKDNTRKKVFDGSITRFEEPTEPSDEEETEYLAPLLISTLRTNSADEDLTCYNYTLNTSINPKTYIYNWILNGNPISDIYYAFDTDTISLPQVKDYSENNNNGTLYGPTWSSDGAIGGSLNFDGDDYIDIPYCFNDNYIDKISVEVWIKTSQNYGTISSYTRDEYWELGLKNGKIRWSTTSTPGSTYDLIGNTLVNDDNWHHIVTTYNDVTGDSKIYVDGELDISEHIYDPGETIGNGNIQNGTIGYGTTAGSETIFSTGFSTPEEKEKWTLDDDRSNDWAYQNEFDLIGDDTLLTLKSNPYALGGSGNLVYYWNRHHVAYNRQTIDISTYEQVKVGIWYSYMSTESDDYLGFYYKDGSNWIPIFEDYNPNIGTDRQLDWTYADANIPDSIDNLILQFYWSTSESREYMAIDDLTVIGLPSSGGTNFSGNIDEYIIYNRALSDEQIYQNYLNKKGHNIEKSVIISDETQIGNIWICNVTPNNRIQDDLTVPSNQIQISTYQGGVD